MKITPPAPPDRIIRVRARQRPVAVDQGSDGRARGRARRPSRPTLDGWACSRHVESDGDVDQTRFTGDGQKAT
ncbi:MAG: hypothetical protein OEZ14_10760, partial [Acidimicrobiia bacterium]|nr:hypothetical protein [Acidimicrobiia bacterium]